MCDLIITMAQQQEYNINKENNPNADFKHISSRDGCNEQFLVSKIIMN